MTIALLFWIVMVVTLVIGLTLTWPREPPYHALGASLLWWILLLLLGWGTFGPPLRA